MGSSEFINPFDSFVFHLDLYISALVAGSGLEGNHHAQSDGSWKSTGAGSGSSFFIGNDQFHLFDHRTWDVA